MNNIGTLAIVLAVIAGAAIVVGIVLPSLKRRNLDMDKIIDQANGAVAAFTSSFETIKPFLPNGRGLDFFDKVVSVTRTGVKNAEQLNKVGKLSAEDRNKEARKYIYDTLRLMGIAMTPEIESVINGAIEAEVFELGHKGELAAVWLGSHAIDSGGGDSPPDEEGPQPGPLPESS